MKAANVENLTIDFSQLPFNLVYVVSGPNDKLGIPNDLIQNCLYKHAPRTHTQVTRPPAPWMKDLNIRQLQDQRDSHCYKAHRSGSESNWKIFRSVRNKIKKILNPAPKSKTN